MDKVVEQALRMIIPARTSIRLHASMQNERSPLCVNVDCRIKKKLVTCLHVYLK